MQVNYTPFIDRVIQKYEGGYGWNRKDPGGPTKYGITCYDLAEHRGQKMTSMSVWDKLVREMTLAEAEAIYAKKYATAIWFHALPSGVDCVMLDYGINSGTSRPIHVARALLKLPAGGMDDAILKAIQAVDKKWFVDQMCAERLRFMHAIRGGSAWAEFGTGWGKRVADLQKYCDHLAVTGTTAGAPVATDLSNVVTPKATNVPKTATAPTAGGTVASGLAAHEAGFHWAAVGGIMAATVAAGVVFEIWQSHKAKAANQLVHV